MDKIKWLLFYEDSDDTSGLSLLSCIFAWILIIGVGILAMSWVLILISQTPPIC